MRKGIQSRSLGRLAREIIFRKQHSKLWTGQLVTLLADDFDTEVSSFLTKGLEMAIFSILGIKIYKMVVCTIFSFENFGS